MPLSMGHSKSKVNPMRDMIINFEPPSELGGASCDDLGTSSATAGLERVAINDSFYEQLLGVPGNNLCADCGSIELLTWASSNLGVVLCNECVGAHRGLGVHISQPLSLKMDVWDDGQCRHMLSLGNAAVNAIYESHPAAATHKPKPTDSLALKVAWVKSKYGGSFKEGGDGVLAEAVAESVAFSHKGQVHAGLAFVKVLRGSGLPNLDNTARLGVDKSDPYVKLTSGRAACQTQVVYDSMEPVWNEMLQLNIDDASRPISLSVWDKDFATNDDHMGDADIPLAGLQAGVATLMVLPLHNVPLGNKRGAKVEVEVSWNPLDG